MPSSASAGGVGAVRGGQRRLPVLERLPVAAERRSRRGRPPGRAGGSRRRRPRARAWCARRAGSASPAASSAPRTRRSSSRRRTARGVLDGAAGEVVAEGERVAAEAQQPGGDALVDRAGGGADLVEQPQLGRAGDDRGESTTARGRRPSAATRRATASRTLAGTPPPAARASDLGDVERVAAGDARAARRRRARLARRAARPRPRTAARARRARRTRAAAPPRTRRTSGRAASSRRGR